MQKATKIGATIGPSCDNIKTLVSMVKAGMNFARLNFSHGDHKSHAKLIKNIRASEKKTGQPIAIMGDIRGPRIRLDGFNEECIKIKTGEVLEFVINKNNLKKRQISIDAPKNLLSFLKAKHTVLIDDGRIEIKILKIRKASFTGKVIEGGDLCQHKGLNFPNSSLNIPPISEKDKIGRAHV